MPKAVESPQIFLREETRDPKASDITFKPNE